MSGETKSWLTQELQPLRWLMLGTLTAAAFSFFLGVTSFFLRDTELGAERESLSVQVAEEGMALGELNTVDAGSDAGVFKQERQPETWMGPSMNVIRSAVEQSILECGEDARSRDPAFPERVVVSMSIHLAQGQATPDDIRLRPETSPHFRGCLRRKMPKIPMMNVLKAEWPLTFEFDRTSVSWKIP